MKLGGFETRPYIFRAFCAAIRCGRLSRIRHSTKDFLTTNRFQGLKFPLLHPPPRGAGEERGGGSETFVVKVGFPFCFIFGCGSAALGSLRLDFSYFVVFVKV